PCSFEGQLRWTTDRVARHYHRRSAKSQEKRRRAGAVSSRGCRKMDQKRRLEGWKAGRLEGGRAGRQKVEGAQGSKAERTRLFRGSVDLASLIEREPLLELGGDIGAAGRGRQIDCRLGGFDRGVEPAGGGIRRRQGIERRQVATAGCGGRALGKRHRLVGLPQRRVGGGGTDPGEAAQRLRVAGTRVENLFELGDRLGRLALLRQQLREVPPRLGVVGPQRQRTVIVLERLVVASGQLQHRRQVVVSLRVVGIEAQRLAEPSNRFVALA